MKNKISNYLKALLKGFIRVDKLRTTELIDKTTLERYPQL